VEIVSTSAGLAPQLDAMEAALVDQGVSRASLRTRVDESEGAPPNTIYFQTVQELRVEGNIAFRPCSSDLDLSDDSTTVGLLDQVASFLGQYPHHCLVVEGHSDQKPQPWGTNLELSAERAGEVARHLSSRVAGAGGRLSAKG
jgi:outer membrane protein OmpA-like peptidoglycan-associated protein